MKGFVYGISLGFRESSQDPSIQGAMGIIFGVNVIMFLPIIYLNFYLNAEIDSYKGLNFAGVQNGLALMMLIWIIFFTMLHEEEEMALNAAVVQSVVKAAVGEDDNVAETGEVVEDSEF